MSTSIGKQNRQVLKGKVSSALTSLMEGRREVPINLATLAPQRNGTLTLRKAQRNTVTMILRVTDGGKKRTVTEKRVARLSSRRLDRTVDGVVSRVDRHLCAPSKLNALESAATA